MSDFDRNVATARAGYADRAAIDAGLRAHMIRVYNYMAIGVALTGIVAWLTFTAAVDQTGGGPRAYAARADPVQWPGDVAADPGAARNGDGAQLRDQPAGRAERR